MPDPADLLATAAAQPHDPGFVPFVRRAQAAGIPVEVVSDGFGFFIEPALARSGVGELPVITARTTFAGRPRVDRVSRTATRRCFVCGTCKRQRVLDHQAAGRAVRLHRRRRERPLRRGLQRHRLRQALARPHLRRGRLAVPALDGVQRDRDVARGDARAPGGPIRRRLPRARRATRSSAAQRSGARAARTRRRTHGRRPTGEPRRASPSAPSVRTTRTGPSRA